MVALRGGLAATLTGTILLATGMAAMKVSGTSVDYAGVQINARTVIGTALTATGLLTLAAGEIMTLLAPQ